MPSQSFFVPVGTPFIFRPGGAPYSFCAQPGAGGSVLIDYSIDNGFSFIPAIPGSLSTPYSFSNYSGVPGAAGVANQGTPSVGPAYAVQGALVRCTPSVAQATFIASDISVPVDPGTYDKVTIGNAAVAYATQNSTSEQTAFSMRFPPGFFNPNRSVWGLDIETWWSCVNSVNVKTIKAYFGPSAFAAATGLEGGTAIGSQVLTSFAGGVFKFGVAGRGDNQTVIAANGGSAGGAGSSTTANVTVSSCNYAGPNAVEQVLSVTTTKATGSESLILDRVRVSYSG
jgi:hypothetical protein